MSNLDENEIAPDEDINLIHAAEVAKKIKAREERDRLLADMVVEQHNVVYNADLTAQSNMGDTGTLANWLFNKGITQTLEQLASSPDASPELKALAGVFSGVYKAVYKDNKVGWKGADDAMHEVQGESILEALMQTMTKKGQLIDKTTREVG